MNDHTRTTTYGILRARRGGGAGLYAQLSARGLYAGTGYYLLARDQLERFRRAAAPLNAWLDEHVGPTAVVPPERSR